MNRIRLKEFMSFVMLTLVLGVASVQANPFKDALSSVKAGQIATLGTTQQPAGLNETTLYNFQGLSDGAAPADLLPGPNGVFYGVATQGGFTGNGCGYPGCGVIFELTPSSGGYTQQVIHPFMGTDGFNPGKGLIKDSNGNLYGTAMWGGPTSHGTVFELTPPVNPGGAWKETILHAFGATGMNDGWYPLGPLFMDANGNLFGATNSNNGTARGTIFEVSPLGGGQWTEQVIYLFTTQSGYDPNSGLIENAPSVNNPNEPAGALYGTTVTGGRSNAGTVFQLVPSTGQWTLNVLYNFSGSNDGGTPVAGLHMDAQGNLFGTTWVAGANNDGVVYEVSPSAQLGGSWTQKVIHTFSGYNGDGASPQSVPVADASGALYLTTSSTVVKLAPAGIGWAETLLYTSYQGNYLSDLLLGSQGTIYGTAASGGTNGKGIVFKLQ